MRLFYDVRSSRPVGEALAAGADVAALLLAAFHATGAVHRASPIDLPLLLVWALIPRALARIVEASARPHGVPRAAALQVGLFLAIAILFVSGNEVLRGLTHDVRSLSLSLLLVLHLAWASGFLLAFPRAHKLHTAFVLATVLIALKEARPLPLLWAPLACGALILSAAVRRALEGSITAPRAATLNLQNARAIALLGAGLAAGVFLAIAGTVWRGPSPSLPQEPRKAAERKAAAGPAAVAKKADAAAGAGIAPGAVAGAGGTPEGERDGARRTGLSYRVPLRRLAAALRDDREALRVRGSGGRRMPGDFATGVLWKAITLSRYDPPSESWSAETTWETRPWPADGKLTRAAGPPGGRTAMLEVEVVTPLVKTFTVPYGTLEIHATLVRSLSENVHGDIQPEPPLELAATYTLKVTPPNPARGPAAAAADPADPAQPAAKEALVEVPSAAEVGVDLRSLAAQFFRGAAAPRARIDALRARFARDFRYSDAAGWRGDWPLRSFLTESKVGNCAYFATSAALLLRAGGIKTRIAAGFSPGEWNRERGELTLRNRMAHAWIEVFLEGAWRAFDPTAWARPDPSYVPPPEALPSPGIAGGGSFDEPFLAGRDGEPPPEALTDLRPRDASARVAGGAGRDEGTARSSRTGDSAAGGLTESARPWRGGVDEGWSWLESSEVSFSGAPGGASADPAAGTAIPAGGMDGSDARAARLAPGNGTEEEDRRTFYRDSLRAVFVLVAVGALGLLVLNFLRRRNAEEEDGVAEAAAAGDPAPGSEADLLRLDENDPRDRVLAEYLRLQAGLERTRSHRLLHQTPEEHARRVARGNEELAALFADLNEILYGVLYDSEAVGEGEAAAASSSCRRIRRLLG